MCNGMGRGQALKFHRITCLPTPAPRLLIVSGTGPLERGLVGGGTYCFRSSPIQGEKGVYSCRYFLLGSIPFSPLIGLKDPRTLPAPSQPPLPPPEEAQATTKR